MTEVVARPRLLVELEQRWVAPASEVVAGAGFGKTTLLTAALNDAAARGEQRYVAVPAGTGPVGLIEALATAWSCGQPPTAGEGPAWFGAALWAMAPSAVCTLVDDAHHLDEEGARLLHEVIDALPANAHLVVAGRRPLPGGPPLPIVLDEQALRFTPEEVAAAQAGGPDGDDERPDLSSLGGWPAAVAVAAATGRVADASVAWSDVLRSSSNAVRRAVAGLALVGPADEHLLAALFGDEAPSVADAVLAEVPLADWRRGHLVVHGLWAEPALASLSAADRRTIPTEAVQALAAVGRPSEAFALATEWGMASQQSLIVRAACRRERLLPDAATAKRWADALLAPRDELVVELLLGIAHRGRDPRAAADHLRRASDLARAEGDTDLETMALGLLGIVAFALQDHAVGAEVHARAQTLAAQGQPAAEVLAVLALTMEDLRRADPGTALTHLALVSDRAESVLGSLATILEARALCELGRSQAALALLGERRGDLRAYHFGVVLLTARCRWALGDISAALAGLGEGAVVAAADGRTDDAAAMDALRRLIAIVTGTTCVADARSATAGTSLSHLLAALADAITVLDERPDQLQELFRFAYGIGGVAMVMVEVRHLLDRATDPIRQPELEGALESARIVGGSMAADALPDADDVAAALPLLPRPVVHELVVRWVAERHGEPPSWSPSLGGADRTGARDRCRERGLEVPNWLIDAADGWSVGVLGPVTVFSVTNDDAPASTGVGAGTPGNELRRERVRALLWLLVVRRSVPRRVAAALLWPDHAPETAANNLRTTLSYLLKVLGPVDDRPGPLEIDRTTIGLRPDTAVDAWRMHADIEAARTREQAGDIAAALQSYRAAAGRWRGEPASDVDGAEWSERAAGDLRAAYVEAAVRASELLVGSEDAEALRLATSASAVDPWSLRALDVEVRANAGLRRDAAARQALRRHSALVAELGLDATRSNPLVGVVARASLGRST